jgi:hypothetical protein
MLIAEEREVLIDVIRTVRRVTAHVLTLHIQLGAVRTVLARKGTVSESEFNGAFLELDALSAADEAIDAAAPTVDTLFADLLSRLERVSGD